MPCEEGWKRSWELADISSKALHEMLSIKPLNHLGQVVAMTEAEVEAQADASAKYEAAARAWHASALEALRLNRLHPL